MLSGKVLQILQEEGPVGIATASTDGPHLVATWLSYLERVGESSLAIPAGGYDKTEENVNAGSPIQLLLASRTVEGRDGPGTGFRLTGRARYVSEGEIYQRIKTRFNWARAALVVDIDEVEQLL